MDTLLSVAKAVNSTRDRYKSIDVHRTQTEAWPAKIPPLTEAEAKKAANLLLDRFYDARFYEERHGMTKAAYYRKIGRKPPPKKQRKLRVTSGNRHTWAEIGTVIVNLERGWRHMVHMLSHYCHQKLRPKDRPHSDSHSHLEKEMVAWVVSQGWLEGKLLPKPRVAKPKAKPDPVAVAHDKLVARLKAWETKAKRAKTAIDKLRKEEAKLRRRREKTVRFTLD